MLYTWERYAYGVLAVKSEEKRTLERVKCNWEYNIEMDFKKADWQAVDLILVIQNVEKSNEFL